MTKDLRSYLTEYEVSHPNEVLRIGKEISADQQVTALVTRMEKEQKYPVLVFTKMLTCAGIPSHFPLVTNLFASRTRCAEALGSTARTVHRDYYQKTRQQPIPPLVISRGQAPVKEVIKTGGEVDLTQAPALRHHYMDPGPYFTAGFLTTYDPDSGIDNCSITRGWINDKNKVRFLPYTVSHNWLNLKKNQEKGQPTRLAYWLGHHPLACLGGQVKLGYPESHYGAMGGLLGEPLRLVPSESLGDDFLIPADAEVVVEGMLKSYELFPEGPFGEYGGYIGPQRANPQFEVTAITHRKDALWHNIMVGHPDHQVMGGLSLEAAIYETVKQRVPSLVNVHVPLSGNCRFHIYLQLDKPWRGDAREAIMSALTVNYVLKHVFVFDMDIDIYDEREVLFAIATRSQWDRDVMLFPSLKSSFVDPSVVSDLGCKGGIDCTKPAGEPFEERTRVDEGVLQATRWEDYLSSSQWEGISKERT